MSHRDPELAAVAGRQLYYDHVARLWAMELDACDQHCDCDRCATLRVPTRLRTPAERVTVASTGLFGDQCGCARCREGLGRARLTAALDGGLASAEPCDG